MDQATPWRWPSFIALCRSHCDTLLLTLMEVRRPLTVCCDNAKRQHLVQKVQPTSSRHTGLVVNSCGLSYYSSCSTMWNTSKYNIVDVVAGRFLEPEFTVNADAFNKHKWVQVTWGTQAFEAAADNCIGVFTITDKPPLTASFVCIGGYEFCDSSHGLVFFFAGCCADVDALTSNSTPHLRSCKCLWSLWWWL